jgi:hypothetical protein
MAGHLPVNRFEQHNLLKRLWEMLDNKNGDRISLALINAMKPFKRYEDDDLTWQKLTDRNEEGDGYVLSAYPVDFNIDGEVQEGAIAEIHLSPDLTVNRIYMVM